MAGNPIVEAIERLLTEFQALDISYYAGGSVASSVHGVPRYTQDVDLVANLKPEHAATLATRLSTEFYADEMQMRDAIRHNRPFNIIHFASGFKIDIFPLLKDAFHHGEFARSQLRFWKLTEEGSLAINVASAEDTILEKLLWYRQGGEVADKQWSDVLGIAATQSLDLAYLRQWAPQLGVADLLDRLFTETGQIGS